MTEYWQSQPRKYCEICKCWYADNKISVDHHERGVRHKANVAQHLREARKKNTEDRRAQEGVARELIRIELEAQRAYDKDMLEQQLSSSITNPEVKKSLAKMQQKAYKNFSDAATVSSKPHLNHSQTQQGSHGKSAKQSRSAVSKESPAEMAARAKAAFMMSYNQRKPVADRAENKLLWWQLSTPEGHCYYYNTVTGETQWEKPDTLQEVKTSEQTTTSSEEQHTSCLQASSSGSDDNVTVGGVKRSSSDAQDGDNNADGGSEAKKPYDGGGYCRRAAYGSWTVVATREQFAEEEVDETQVEIVARSTAEGIGSGDEKEEIELKKGGKDMFKERTIDSLGDGLVKEEPVQPGGFSGFSFKKRTNFKKPQFRQRTTENDY